MSDHSDKLALFDFDGTLYKYDSILSFCLFYYRKKPQRTWRFIKQVFYWLLWKFKRINTSEFKSRFICFIEGDTQIEVERMARLFWENNTSFNSAVLLELFRTGTGAPSKSPGWQGSHRIWFWRQTSVFALQSVFAELNAL